MLSRGLANRRAALGSDAGALAPWRVALGESLLALGRREEAREHLEAARRSFERDGASAEDYARVWAGLAEAWSEDAPERALVYRQWANGTPAAPKGPPP